MAFVVCDRKFNKGVLDAGGRGHGFSLRDENALLPVVFNDQISELIPDCITHEDSLAPIELERGVGYDIAIELPVNGQGRA